MTSTRLAEIASGEIRTLCHGCGRVIGHRSLYCENCRPTRGRFCTSCGNPSNAAICQACKTRRPQTLSEDNRETAERLWAEGFGAREIAEKLGIRTNHPGTMISKARRRGWDFPYRRPDMVKHGKRIAKRYLKKGNASTRMRRLPGIENIDRRSDAARAAVERMWAEGFTAREISENMGWSPANPGANICKARKRGWNLPYRNPGVVEESRKRCREFNGK